LTVNAVAQWCCCSGIHQMDLISRPDSWHRSISYVCLSL